MIRKESGYMDSRGIIAQKKYLQIKCPFCHENLDKMEILKRKVNKVCKCKKCGEIIDERYIVR
jgi:ribosomal protein L37AE/L43A